ncbi:phosphoglucosamine mutase [Endozoicomonas sp. G2_2]|uniref:phosphoglucosamine mutase n=1 Tax=Endozoicomonas sp. G2_2 TaxID=2821092 RepID=UPI001ADB46A5|nr:phosphoglucosamine mutase [Endozoicomonas sp. G2_2]
MAQRYFGTDGIRGEVGESPMTPDFSLKLGWAAGRVLIRRLGEHGVPESPGERAQVLIGKDTRLSGYMFESALEAGFAAAGVDVLLVGPLPTPAIAYLARTFRAAAGVVISASHNPYADNGVKFFSHFGQKLADEVEREIEAAIDEPLTCVASDKLGRARRVESAPGRYIEFCKSTARFENGGLSGLKVVIDCANGATYHVAPDVFRELGAQVEVIGDKPDGLNINRDCGSTHPKGLSEAVRQAGADVGIALDGDGDRCIMVDHEGNIVDGDQLLYVIADARRRAGELQGPVVGTLMSNLGLALALKRDGVAFERAQVGDRHVFERLRALGANIGGESSGHILCLDRATTGDGIVSALQVLAAMVAAGESLQTLVQPVDKCPQTLVNVRVTRGSAGTLMDDERVTSAVREVESSLGEEGRVLLRPSGTEPLLRVMVEGMDAVAVEDCANRLADTVRDAAGAA